jgi:HNH endonuclease
MNNGVKMSRWYKLRKSVLIRDKNLCMMCGRRATTVDHIVPVFLGWIDEWDPDNLRSLCKDCHKKKTARDRSLYGNKQENFICECGHFAREHEPVLLRDLLQDCRHASLSKCTHSIDSIFVSPFLNRKVTCSCVRFTAKYKLKTRDQRSLLRLLKPGESCNARFFETYLEVLQSHMIHGEI